MSKSKEDNTFYLTEEDCKDIYSFILGASTLHTLKTTGTVKRKLTKDFLKSLRTENE